MDLSTTCPVCGQTRHKPLYPASYGKLLSCQICQTVFFVPRPTPAELQAFYDSSQYREHYHTSSMADLRFAERRYQELRQILQRFNFSGAAKADKTLLDVGCGTGDFLAAAMQDGWRITGTELSLTAAQQAQQRLGCPILTGDVNTLTLPEASYDLITSYHVIEHLLDPVSMLQRLRQLVKPEGAVFLETPNMGSLGARLRGPKWSHIIPPEHITYFKPASLKSALQQAGFQRVFVFTSAPQVIESTQNWPTILQFLVKAVYGIAPRLNLGAALQALAFRH